MAKKKKIKIPELEFEEENKKLTFAERVKAVLRPDNKKHTPISFNVGVAVILFFIYLIISFVSLPAAPALLIVLIPTLYILLRYIRLERDKGDYY
jgi:uncharacterized membrane protein